MSNRNFLIDVPSTTDSDVVVFRDGQLEAFVGVNDFGRAYIRLRGIEGKLVVVSTMIARLPFVDFVAHLSVLDRSQDSNDIGKAQFVPEFNTYERCKELAETAELEARTYRGILTEDIIYATRVWITAMRGSFPHVLAAVEEQRKTMANTDGRAKHLRHLIEQAMHRNVFELPPLSGVNPNLDHVAAAVLVASLNAY